MQKTETNLSQVDVLSRRNNRSPFELISEVSKSLQGTSCNTLFYITLCVKGVIHWVKGRLLLTRVSANVQTDAFTSVKIAQNVQLFRFYRRQQWATSKILYQGVSIF